MDRVRTIVVVDLVGYSSISEQLEQSADVDVVARLNQQIQSFVDAGLNAARVAREKVVIKTTGDGAIVKLDSPEIAHRFAATVQQASLAHNASRNAAVAKRVFRIGVATGEVAETSPYGNPDIAGTTISRAARLEAACPAGGVLIDAISHSRLPPDLQTLYAGPQEIAGKRDERFRTYAWQANADGPADIAWTRTPGTGGTVTSPLSQAPPPVSAASEQFDGNDRPTLLQTQFAKHFTEAFERSNTSDIAFRDGWLKARQISVFNGLDDLLRDMDSHAEQPRKWIVDMKTTMRNLGWLTPGVATALPPQTGRWVLSMLLVMAERWIQTAAARPGDGQPHLSVDRATVASVLGALMLNRGVHLVMEADPADGQSKLRALNVLYDMPALEYGFVNAADAARAELAAALNAWHEGGTLMRRKAHLQRAAALGVRPHSREALDLGLKQFEEEHGLRFSFAAPATEVPAPLQDQAALAQLRELGVETFLFGPPADDTADTDGAEAWASLVGDLVHYLDEIASKFIGAGHADPVQTVLQPTAGPARNHIFISYSHDQRDTYWKKELLTHLHAFDRSLIDVWVDTRIGAGQDWEKEIHAAMAQARVAVFLVSPNFLSSKFITTVEVPTLIARQRSEGMEIMPILIRDCTWKRVPWLDAMQIRPGSEPLASHGDSDRALSTIVDEIYVMCHPNP